MKSVIPLLLFILISCNCIAQRSIKASRIQSEITLDGYLDEDVWKEAEIATDFTNWQPTAGTTPSQPTEVKILYDDQAIYIGAYMKEDSRDDIMMELSDRDDIGNTDWFGFVLDTYGNATDAIELIIAVTGTQFDAKVNPNQGEDTDWDAVWFSEVHITDQGWYAELRIPYNVIRFPNQEVQNWKINFMRRQAKTGEKNSFQFLDPEVNGFITQTADLTNVNNIKPPLRLTFSPYVSAYALHSKDPGRTPVNSTGYSYNGGMDVKYGINESFTLDMTLIPDFGQVQSDRQVLNLSPFEVQFSENRPFFTEGTEIFSKGNLFYSRRIGGTPIGHWKPNHSLSEGEVIEDNPGETQLYNATKLSGRTNAGLGIGIFNAVAANTHATIKNTETGVTREVETAPFTNYNVLVLDQNLGNNSSLSLTNTNVWRAGNEFHDANVTALTFNLKNPAQSYEVEGALGFSQLLNPQSSNVNGLQYSLRFGKIAGNFNLFVGTDGTAPDFNSNDLGFLQRTDVRGYYTSANYQINNEFWSFNRANFWGNASAGTRYNDNAYRFVEFNTGFWTQAKNFWEYNMWANFGPTSHDYFEPRTEGRYLQVPTYFNTGLWMGTDSRRKLRLSTALFGMKWMQEGRQYLEYDIDIRYRINNNMTVGMGTGFDHNFNDIGYVNHAGNDIIMGRRDRYLVPSEIYARYTFNDKMNVRFDLRHYWVKVFYDKFYSLNEDGSLADSDYNQFHDLSFNQFNIDMVYRWRFAPGSDLFFVWKNNIAGFESDPTINHSELSFWRDGVQSLRDLAQNNSISLRLVYFLDYNELTH